MTEADKLSLTLAVVTMGVVIATGFLAWFTYKLAKRTAEGNLQADRHHQQDLRPFCEIEFSGAAQSSFVFGVDFDPAMRRLKANMGSLNTTHLGNEIYIRGELKNKASALAKDVVVYLNARLGAGDNNVFRLTRPVVVSGLIGGGATIAIDVVIKADDIMQVWIGTEWKDTRGIEFIPDGTYELI